MLADKGSMLLFCNEHPVYPTPFFFKSLLSPWMAFGTLVGNHLTIHGSWFAKSCLTNLQPHGLQPHQDPLSMEFSRQEYWSGLQFPSPGDLPDRGIKPRSPALQAGFLHYRQILLLTELQGKSLWPYMGEFISRLSILSCWSKYLSLLHSGNFWN